MSTPDIAPIQTRPAGSVSEPAIVTFAVNDPKVLLALAEHPEGPARTHFLVTALKVGVLSLKAARGTLDSDTVRREGDRLMEQLGERLNAWRGKFEERVTGSLSHYFDPKQGLFVERVDRLTKADGELATVVRQQVKDAEQSLSRVFDQFIGENSQLLKALDPSGDNQLIANLQRTLDGVVQAQNASILHQFSLDNKEGALVRFLSELAAKHGDLNQALSANMQAVVAEFSLDKEDSALSRLVHRVETAQRSLTSELSLDNENSALKRMYKMFQEHQATMLENQRQLAATLDAAVQALQARRQEAARGTRHGVEFEQALGQHLRSLAAAAGDVVEDTGSTTGLIDRCKVGDHVITIGPEKVAAGARIVVEAKESASCDLARTLEEADLARRNRGAGVGVFVHSTKTAPAGIPAFARYGHDLVVQWDAESESGDVWLQAALMVATALSVRAASHGKQDAASFAKIDKAIERLARHAEDFTEIDTCANTARNAAEKILKRAALMRQGLSDQVEVIAGEFLKLKDRAADRE
ncbi:hypothetical protein [Ramlibacter tataouinensis]|uniref:Uncharacterized protein n=1 Tax=Ramlibacter tataouinensis (strain ATCC BAA-407 / DSM 14655 / LMG 21543 / TTB310) TaxID=365046 RepID=F5Y3V0_RAMTT|nr:hypothetical protein [Ramlibacter tataouinensis]AEG91228.1 Hypothetical protein Rta_01640 [Ramlibacter tataouinensis TTB310]